jgi:hypothetical protein
MEMIRKGKWRMAVVDICDLRNQPYLRKLQGIWRIAIFGFKTAWIRKPFVHNSRFHKFIKREKGIHDGPFLGSTGNRFHSLSEDTYWYYLLSDLEITGIVCRPKSREAIDLFLTVRTL